MQAAQLDQPADLGGGQAGGVDVEEVQPDAVAIGTLIRRFPRMELTAEPEFSGRMTLRGLRELQLDLGT